MKKKSFISDFSKINTTFHSKNGNPISLHHPAGKIQNKTLALLFLAFLIHFLPFFIQGDGAYIRIHDNLEGEWMWLHLLKINGMAFEFSADAKIAQVMNGVERNAFPSGFSVPMLLVMLFGSYWGYLINYALIHTIAFVAMYLLLKTHFLKEQHQWNIALAVSLCFSMIPFFNSFGISVAGQPLLLLAVLNILKKRDSLIDFLIFFLFPFYSSIVWAGTSVLFAMGLTLLVYTLIKRHFHFRLFGAMVLMAVMYALVNFQMIQLSFFNSEFISHREAYNIFEQQDVGFIQSLLDSVYPFFFAHYHVGTTVTLPVLIAAFFALYFFGNNRWLKYLLLSAAVICLLYGSYIYIAHVFGDMLPFLITFKANRFIILLPLIWMLLLAVSLAKLQGIQKMRLPVTVILCCAFISAFFSNDEWLHNMRQLSGRQLKPSYKDFFSEPLFQEIEQFIGLPKSEYRVASLGMNPSIAQYNGFYTLDGLQAIYPLQHKSQFREIIAPELEKNEEIRKYFDAWGNRCYLFASEMGTRDRHFMIGKNQDVVLQNFEINPEAFKKMGGQYLFSTCRINQPEKSGLKLLRQFELSDSYWKIYLYEST